MNLPARLSLCASLAVLLGAMAVPAAADVRKTSNASQLSSDPAIVARVLRARYLATLPDGSFIATVNGKRQDIRMRPGETLTIIGKGFDQQRSASIVGLRMPGQTTGAELAIVSWSDRQIVVRVPAGNVNLPHGTDHARLSVQIVRATGVWLTMAVENIRLRVRREDGS